MPTLVSEHQLRQSLGDIIELGLIDFPMISLAQFTERAGRAAAARADRRYWSFPCTTRHTANALQSHILNGVSNNVHSGFVRSIGRLNSPQRFHGSMDVMRRILANDHRLNILKG
ncbi:hypothetical protein LQG66_09950 [Bradyrhizobium ontarionense]|uniref:Uncharacterized protein n=1 Tax=Bradyrhizobium ontarionense TaxID=2898149 RepID=A0ABY3RGL0_9BRAD|nr:hypothetical protein [Bradyrhizobium sp. A19]UFZ06590.1 hypothetical protein LQG66_09950 [Bradyrhizobium sp. A19]